MLAALVDLQGGLSGRRKRTLVQVYIIISLSNSLYSYSLLGQGFIKYENRSDQQQGNFWCRYVCKYLEEHQIHSKDRF